MEKIIGTLNFENFGMNEESYLNDTDCHEMYEIADTRYDMLFSQVRKMANYIYRLKKKGEDIAMIKKAYLMLFNAENRRINPFYEMETIEVKDGYGITPYGKAVVCNRDENRVADGTYAVIIPPIIINNHQFPYNYTPFIVEGRSI